MNEIKPFFINSNICLDNINVSSFDLFMKSVAGNTGNAYITYGLIKEIFGNIREIDHIQNIYEYDFSRMDNDIDFINNECTHVFLILQDQIRISESYGLQLPYEGIMTFIKKLNKPVIIAGLGANSFELFEKDFHKKLNPDLVTFLKFLSDHCNEIGIRGYFTQEVLHNLDIKNTNVIGCPSFYEKGRNRIINKKRSVHPSKILLSSAFDNRYLRNNYQAMQDYNEEKMIRAIAFNDFDNTFSEVEIKELKSQKFKIFSNINNWQQFVKNFDFVIGLRLHGAILSINAGVPAICCNQDARAREMCEFLKIPNRPVSPDDNIIQIYNDTDFDEMNKNYPALYDNFERFLNNNNIALIKDSYKNDLEQPNMTIYNSNFIPELNAKIILEKIDNIENIENKLLSQINELNNKLDLQIDLTNELKEKLDKPTFLQQIFSIKNDNNWHKVVTIFGIKIKLQQKITPSAKAPEYAPNPEPTPAPEPEIKPEPKPEPQNKLINGNQIILIENAEEKIITNENLPNGLNINFSTGSKNNVIKIELPQNFSNSLINFEDASNCLVEIKSTKNYINNLYIHMGQSSEMKVKINKNVSICQASILSNQTKSEVEIGEDCMIASGVKIVGSDGHTIIDNNSEDIINYQKNKCYIGNHVWLGDECRIMKNAIIPDNSIVAANSVVSKKFDEKNIIIAGNPACMVKRNINWKRDVLIQKQGEL